MTKQDKTAPQIESDLKAQLSRQERQIQQLLLEREQMKASVDWQVAMKFRSLLNFFLPNNSARYTFFLRIFIILVATKKAGVKAGLAEFKASVRGLKEKIAQSRFRKATDCRISAVKPMSPYINQHGEHVDIVICVHNALNDVRACLSSVLEHTAPPYTIILVDDGSGKETADYLAEFSKEQQATLIRHDDAKGYTLAANAGLRASTHPLVVLLNSDTIVTPTWLDRMIRAAAQSPKTAAVGPLSNTASWQSIPHIFDEDGDWCLNPLPEGISPAAFARILAQHGSPIFPTLPLLNGFCMLIKKRALDSIGFFDEENFGAGFGEENDFALRAAKKGWQLALADDAFIYHAQSKSYSDERRLKLSANADKILIKKHGSTIKDQGLAICQHHRSITSIRAMAQNLMARHECTNQGRSRYEGKRVLFLLPILGAGGGGHVIIQEAHAMQRMGVDVRILNLAANRVSFESEYPDVLVPVDFVDDPAAELSVGDYDAVIATHYMSVTWLNALPEKTARGYYIQDYEPLFYDSNSLEYTTAKNSYTAADNLRLFTKTQWNQKTLIEHENLTPTIIGESVDVDLFRPRHSTRPIHPSPIRIAAMIRPNTPRRAPQLTMDIAAQIKKKYGKGVEIHLFGCSPADKDFQTFNHTFDYIHWGILDREEMASLLSQTDIFADFSTFQAMGLTALEAMLCGNAVIIPENGGCRDFATNGENALIIDSKNEKACFDALASLIDDGALRLRLQQGGIYCANEFYPESAALHILQTLLE